jgi:hypothetical protein
MQDRARVWQDIERWRSHGDLPVVPIELDDIVIAGTINAGHFRVADDVPMTPATRRTLAAQLHPIHDMEVASWPKVI